MSPVAHQHYRVKLEFVEAIDCPLMIPTMDIKQARML
jgi:hypothetical protein